MFRGPSVVDVSCASPLVCLLRRASPAAWAAPFREGARPFSALDAGGLEPCGEFGGTPAEGLVTEARRAGECGVLAKLGQAAAADAQPFADFLSGEQFGAAGVFGLGHDGTVPIRTCKCKCNLRNVSQNAERMRVLACTYVHG